MILVISQLRSFAFDW